jgi:single-strand DNA-binding protein
VAGYNRIIIVGNLTRDPEYKQLTSGQGVCRLGLATNRQFKNRQSGSMVQEVCYIDIDVWGAQAESCRQYLQKGRGVLIEGRLKFDSWEDANGQTRSKHSIVADRVVFLGSTAGEAESIEETDAPATGSQNARGTYNAAPATSAPIKAAVRPAAPVRPEPQSELEKELFDQIDQIKKRTTKPKVESKIKAVSEEQSSTGEINFTDEPPFEDDLPF